MSAGTNEQATRSDGLATLNFTALSDFPVSQKQQLMSAQYYIGRRALHCPHATMDQCQL